MKNLSSATDAFRYVRKNIRPCQSPYWASTGHLQTIFGHSLPSPRLQEKAKTYNVTLESEEERIITSYIKGETNYVVYLFHGLGGSSEATYMHRTAIVARNLGHHVFMNNHRGCGEGKGLATEPYHSGRAEDLSAVIAFGRNLFPHHIHIAIGFSLSANALLLMAAKVRATVLPDIAIAINGPINLDVASLRLTQGINRIYDMNFLLSLKTHVAEKEFPKAKNIREFDEVYTAPRGGFKNRQDYYDTCSAVQYLSRIEIPTVLLSSYDDPFVDVEDYLSATLSNTTVLHLEKNGGHMGYIGKVGFSYYRWLDYALTEYLTSISHLS